LISSSDDGGKGGGPPARRTMPAPDVDLTDSSDDVKSDEGKAAECSVPPRPAAECRRARRLCLRLRPPPRRLLRSLRYVSFE
jgi:hypothetical protein